jgi:hypothetical protein
MLAAGPLALCVCVTASWNKALITIWTRLAGGLIDIILKFLVATAGGARITSNSYVTTGALADSIPLGCTR